MSRPADRVVAFYNKRGTAEQWIKEGKGGRPTQTITLCYCARAVRRRDQVEIN
jgi:hypothetical protein